MPGRVGNDGEGSDLERQVLLPVWSVRPEGWIGHARALEQAGAAAIELNVYSIPVDLTVSGAEVERQYLEIVRQVRSSVRIPVSVNAGSAKTGSTPSTRFADSRTRPTWSTSIPCSARSTWRPSPNTSPASSSSKRYLGGEGVRRRPGILSSSNQSTSRPPRRSCRRRDSGGGYRRCCTGSARGTGPSRTHA
jgi:hypothetical protein